MSSYKMKYTDENRGIIQNRRRARQIIDYSGVRYGNGTPTDIDGFLEKGKEAFVFYEMKYGNATMPRGQKLALMRMVDVITSAGKKAVLFSCRHNVDNPDEDINAAEAKVESLYFNGEWTKVDGHTLKDMTDRFLRWACPFLVS